MSYPRISLSLDNMRQEIVFAFGKYNEDVKQAVDEAIKKAISAYDIDRVAYDIALEVLDGMVRDAVRTAVADKVATEISDRFAKAFE